jgi:hypothetical protein
MQLRNSKPAQFVLSIFVTNTGYDGNINAPWMNSWSEIFFSYLQIHKPWWGEYWKKLKELAEIFSVAKKPQDFFNFRKRSGNTKHRHYQRYSRAIQLAEWRWSGISQKWQTKINLS